MILTTTSELDEDAVGTAASHVHGTGISPQGRLCDRPGGVTVVRISVISGHWMTAEPRCWLMVPIRSGQGLDGWKRHGPLPGTAEHLAVGIPVG